MPRLVGKRSNKGVIYTGVFLVLAIAVAGTLEYVGAIDLIPDFGKSTRLAAPVNPPVNPQ